MTLVWTPASAPSDSTRARNERLYRLAGALPGSVAYSCECGRSDCDELVVLVEREYLERRANPPRLLAARGHDRPSLGSRAPVRDSLGAAARH
jgi:hypothetical protein